MFKLGVKLMVNQTGGGFSGLKMQVWHQKESIRTGSGYLILYRAGKYSGYSICSSNVPQITSDTMFVRGGDATRDYKIVGLGNLTSSEPTRKRWNAFMGLTDKLNDSENKIYVREV